MHHGRGTIYRVGAGVAGLVLGAALLVPMAAAAGAVGSGNGSLSSDGARRAPNRGAKPHPVHSTLPSSALAGVAPTATLRRTAVTGAAAAPTLTVTPNTNLAPSQDVTVSGTGLPPGTGGNTAGLVIVECETNAVDLSQCGFNSAELVFPDASGNLSAPYRALRTLARPFDTLRCDDSPQTCSVFVINLLGAQDAAFIVSAAVTFDASIPRPTATLTVTPSTGLLDGQTVSVHGTGWPESQGEIALAECSVGGACSSGVEPAPVDVAADGTFTVPFAVKLRTFDADGNPTHCLAVACILRADDFFNIEYSTTKSIAFDPNQPLPPIPAITVTPASGLHHGQQVTVSGTGFDAGGYAEVTECPPGASGFCPDTIGAVEVIAPDGTFTTTVSVSRLVTDLGGFFGGPGGVSASAVDTPPVDCIDGGCTINVNESTDQEFGLNAGAPIEFDPADPPPTIPEATAAPLTNLPYRAVITLQGTGFAPGEQVFAESCIEAVSNGSCNGFAEGVADGSGAVTLNVAVRRRAIIDNTVLDCVDPSVQCSVSLSGQHGYEQFTFPLSFDPTAPIPDPPTITVAPHDNLGYRQDVQVAGDGFTPSADVEISECITLPVDPALPIFGPQCGGSTLVTADANGHIDGTFTARRIIGGGFSDPIDCATRVGPSLCMISVTEGSAFDPDPLSSASSSLTFDANAPVPPLPVVHVSPTTHLVDGQTIDVTGSGFSPNTFVFALMCAPPGSNGANCGFNTGQELITDGAGNFALSFVVSSQVEMFNGSVDCTVAPGCGLAVVSDSDPVVTNQFTPLSFDVPDLPELELHGVTVQEGTGGVTPAPVTVELSDPAPRPVVIHWKAVPGTATTADYTAAAGTLTIPAGATSGTIPAEVVADALDEPTERFTIEVDSVTGATVEDGSARVKIKDDDDEPDVLTGDVTSHEGDGVATIGVMLSAPSGRDVTVEYRTHHHSARSGSDFVRSRGVVTIPAGQLGGLIRIPIVDDGHHEDTENFRVELDNAEHADLDRHHDDATVTILDND